MGRMEKKRHQREETHGQPGAKTELVDAEERALELSKDAIDRELFAGSPEAPAILQSSFEIYCLHASNRYPPARRLKYFVRLAAIGTAYALLLARYDAGISRSIASCGSRSAWTILEGKVASGSVR